jgi:hypothetical protein
MNIQLKKCLATLLFISSIASMLSAQSKKVKPLTLGTYKNEGYYGNLYQLEKNKGYDFLGKLPIFVGDLLSLTKENRKTENLLFVYTVPKYFYRASKNRNLPFYDTRNALQANRIFNNMTTVIDAPFDKWTIGNKNTYLSTDAGMFLLSATPDKLSVLSLIGQAEILKNLRLVTENFHFLTTFDNQEVVGSTSLELSYNKFSFSTGVAYNLYSSRKSNQSQDFDLTTLRAYQDFSFLYPSVFFYIEGKINLF